MKKSISNQRLEYTLKSFNQEDAHPDPFIQFHLWFEEATEAYPLHANAMIISTSGKDGKSSSRVVLLKDIENGGFVFFTNYSSRKGKNLVSNPYASLLFFWPDLERQIRIEGKTEIISASSSSAYFTTRPRESQIASLASAQSEKISDRKTLEKKFEEIDRNYQGKEIPRPDNWGGFCLKPYYFEFWQGRTMRMHDRIIYSKENENWVIGRLSP